MNGSFDSGFGRGFGSNFGSGSGGPGGPNPWEFLDQLRSMFEQRTSTPRMARGDVRTAVLSLLAEQPMHGYQIISEIEQRSGGSWKPSAGSVYPTLQLLADEGLIEATEADGRKTYALTDAGRDAAEEAAGRAAPWEAQRSSGMGALPKAGIELAQAAAQVGRTGSPEQVAEAVAVLEEARRRLYSILAQG
ncbi:PadR family transcriptional regulator [Microbacterium sp. ASV49]|uniref:PadR family transcriptional regulator n=1 Tax=Microbacterium candidum TaxID=3041922 RepID=A0ABT7N188_9MICO|nr:PadR family transcriptional regulator [Microbacterium sp. ASV49]MDL9980462.1 PadR family transcriptional regulator [Microbacterium sp. ASV49]